MADRITGRLNDGTVFVHSETGNEGVGHFTTQRRLPEIVCKLARFEDKIESGDLVEVVRCGQCRHATEDIIVEGVCYCHKIQQGMFVDGFCNYGERRKE